MDTNLRIRADAMGMVAETYTENMRARSRAARHGNQRRRRRRKKTSTIFPKEGWLGLTPAQADAIHANVCVLLRDRREPVTHTALGRYGVVKREVIALRTPREGGHRRSSAKQRAEFCDRSLARRERSHRDARRKSRNGENAFGHRGGFEEDDRRRNVHRMPRVASGDAARARHRIFARQRRRKIEIPWMRLRSSTTSNFFFRRARVAGRARMRSFLESGQIQVEPLTYIRGRSLP